MASFSFWLSAESIGAARLTKVVCVVSSAAQPESATGLPLEDAVPLDDPPLPDEAPEDVPDDPIPLDDVEVPDDPVPLDSPEDPAPLDAPPPEALDGENGLFAPEELPGSEAGAQARRAPVNPTATGKNCNAVLVMPRHGEGPSRGSLLVVTMNPTTVPRGTGLGSH
jgi:hypothetical protein